MIVTMSPISTMPVMRGYGLLELLIATAIGCVLLGVLLQFAVSAQTSAGVQSEIADLHQRLRVAMDAMRHDITACRRWTNRGVRDEGLSRTCFRRSWPPGLVQPVRIRNCPFARTVSASCTSRTTRAQTKLVRGHDVAGVTRLPSMERSQAADRPRPAISSRAQTS